MNFELEREFSKAPILGEIDELKTQLDSLRPLAPDIEGRVMQKLRLEWNYNSNAIEGNQLNYGETVAFLMTGITAKGKPLKDYLDIKGHNEAINFLLSIVKETQPLTESDIRALHKMILTEPYEVDALTAEGKPTKKTIKIGEYKTQANHVRTATGETHYYTTPEETPAKMQQLMEWYHTANEDDTIHPVVVAALLHHKFVEIHPFDDGNGRLSRMLMNLVLMRNDYPPAIIKMDDRQNYYALLSQADTGDSWPFVEHIIERVQSSLQLYLKAINGGDIDEDEDIDKEIALFKMELQEGAVANEQKSNHLIVEVLQRQIFPLINKLIIKFIPFNELFFNNNKWLKFYYYDGSDNQTEWKSFDESKINGFLDYVFKSKNEFFQIKFEIDYLNYKNPENDFNIESSINFEFHNYTYVVNNGSTNTLSKLYHEDISNSEQAFIIRNFFQKFKSTITSKTKI